MADWFICRHVGLYGREGGDIPAKGTLKLFGSEPPVEWAVLGIATTLEGARAMLERFRREGGREAPDHGQGQAAR